MDGDEVGDVSFERIGSITMITVDGCPSTVRFYAVDLTVGLGKGISRCSIPVLRPQMSNMGCRC